jgi:hypothetical protein
MANKFCEQLVAANDLGFVQPGPWRGLGLAEIGVPFPLSQFTPAVELKQDPRARIVPSLMLCAIANY